MLTCVLEKREHSGCVRGRGGYLTQTTYYKYPRERREKVDETKKCELEDAKKLLAEYGSRL